MSKQKRRERSLECKDKSWEIEKKCNGKEEDKTRSTSS